MLKETIMKHEIKLPIALLKAAVLCASDDDFIRPMLENIAIDNGCIVGTNGCILFYSQLENVDPDIEIQIPKIHVQSFLEKIESYTSFKFCKLVFDTESSEGYLEIPNVHCAYEGFKNYFKYEYMDWKKVIPEFKECSFSNLEMPVFNPNYLQLINEISNSLGNICYYKMTPLGIKDCAIVDFYRTEYIDVHAYIMPMIPGSDEILYCVEMGSEADGDYEQVPAESADIAFAAVNRMQNELNYSLGVDGYFQNGSWIRPALWMGSPHEHSEKMFYTKEWFKKPLKKYSTAEQAKAYISATNDCVKCYDENRSITAYTLEDVDKFFAGVIL